MFWTGSWTLERDTVPHPWRRHSTMIYLQFFFIFTLTFIDSFTVSLCNILKFILKVWNIWKTKHCLNVEMSTDCNGTVIQLHVSCIIWNLSYIIVTMVNKPHMFEWSSSRTELNTPGMVPLGGKYWYCKYLSI